MWLAYSAGALVTAVYLAKLDRPRYLDEWLVLMGFSLVWPLVWGMAVVFRSFEK